MCLVSISLLVVTFTFRIQHALATNYSTKELKPHASRSHRCHGCDLGFGVMFYNVTSYIGSILPQIHVNAACPFNITCALVATSTISGRLESVSRASSLIVFWAPILKSVCKLWKLLFSTSRNLREFWDLKKGMRTGHVALIPGSAFAWLACPPILISRATKKILLHNPTPILG